MPATALAGSSTSPLTVSVTTAVQSSSSSIFSTRPTGTSATLTAGLRHQVQDVEELHLHGVRLVAEVGAAGQVERVGTAEAAAAEQQHAAASAASPRGRRVTVRRHRRESDAADRRRSAPPPPPPPRSACRSSSCRPCRSRPGRRGSPSASASPESSRAQIARSSRQREQVRRVGAASMSGRQLAATAELGQGPADDELRRCARRARCRGCRGCRSRGCRRARGCPARPARRRAPRRARPAAGPGRAVTSASRFTFEVSSRGCPGRSRPRRRAPVEQLRRAAARSSRSPASSSATAARLSLNWPTCASMVASAVVKTCRLSQRAEQVLPVRGQGLDRLREAGERAVQRLAVALEVGRTDVDAGPTARRSRWRRSGPSAARQLVERAVDLVELDRRGGAVQRDLGAVLHRRAAVVDRRELHVAVGHQRRREDDGLRVGRDVVVVVDDSSRRAPGRPGR